MATRDPKKHREYNAAWRAANAERERSNVEAWHKKNPGYYAGWYARNREKRKAETRAYTARNPGKAAAAVQSWRERNKEHEREYRKKYRKENAELMRTIAHKRYARKVGNGGRGVSPAEWLALLEQFGGKCAYCGAHATERDHVYPIVRGGKDEPENVVPSCRSCNARKRSKLPIQWMLSLAAR